MRVFSRRHRIAIFMSLLAISVGFIWVVGTSAEPPLGILGDVTVQNDATNPVPVTIQGSVIKAGEPFQKGILATISSGTTGFDEIILTVPSDQRVVVEFVSARGFFPEDRPLICNIRGTNSLEGHFLLVDTVSRNTDFVKIVSQPVLLFLGPDKPVTFGCSVAQPPLADDELISISISGRFYDIN